MAINGAMIAGAAVPLAGAGLIYAGEKIKQSSAPSPGQISTGEAAGVPLQAAGGLMVGASAVYGVANGYNALHGLPIAAYATGTGMLLGALAAGGVAAAGAAMVYQHVIDN
jgi:hypothetical protein